MNRLSILASAVAVTALSLFPIAPTLAQMTHGTMQLDGMSQTSMAYAEAMKKMDMEMSAVTMTGQPGEDFALMMIPHHQSAIDMATAYLASGDDDPELMKLANEIIAAQEKEIAFLRQWLQKNGK